MNGIIVHKANYEHIAFVLAEKLRRKAESRGVGDSFYVVEKRKRRVWR